MILFILLCGIGLIVGGLPGLGIAFVIFVLLFWLDTPDPKDVDYMAAIDRKYARRPPKIEPWSVALGRDWLAIRRLWARILRRPPPMR